MTTGFVRPDAGLVEGVAQLREGELTLGLGTHDQRLDEIGGAGGGRHGGHSWVLVTGRVAGRCG